MNNATSNHIRDSYPARTPNAKTIAPTVGSIRQLAGADKRCRRNTERQTPVGTRTDASHGFLKTTFLPKLKVTPSLKACRKMETDFYHSLSQLSLYYGIQPMSEPQEEFPYNIALSLWDIQRKLRQKCLHWQTLRLVQEADKTFLISEERYSTGDTLYYIPVIPLFRMLKAPHDKQVGQLLLSVCAYLYQIVGVPYYRQQNSYLYWMYEMLHEWMEEEEETEDSLLHKKELRKAEWMGDYMEQKIYNHHNLAVFEQRLNRFKSRSESDLAYYQLANDAFSLYRDYPGANVFRNVRTQEKFAGNVDNEDETIAMDKYISFFADCKGILYDSLCDCINNELNESGEIEEPFIEKCFNGNTVTDHNLNFESRVFGLISDLCFLLNHYN